MPCLVIFIVFLRRNSEKGVEAEWCSHWNWPYSCTNFSCLSFTICFLFEFLFSFFGCLISFSQEELANWNWKKKDIKKEEMEVKRKEVLRRKSDCQRYCRVISKKIYLLTVFKVLLLLSMKLIKNFLIYLRLFLLSFICLFSH